MSTYHESLSAEFAHVPAIHPVERMDPYEPCWCLSGKKWKFCHKDRHKLTPIPIGKMMHDMHVAATRGYCAHPAGGGSCGKAINAHTIQRRGGLSEIAEDGHVYSVKEGAGKLFETGGVLLPHRIGSRSASTFAGFCGRHDREMFAPIETGTPTLSRENAFLFSFRALAYEQFHKRVATNVLTIQKQLDFGAPFNAQAAIQIHMHHYGAGLERGIEDICGWKRLYDDAYVSGDYSGFSAYVCMFEHTIPVACCGAFQPEFDFFGTPLQKVSRGQAAFEHVAVTLTPSMVERS
jgi:hypothetical protein